MDHLRQAAGMKPWLVLLLLPFPAGAHEPDAKEESEIVRSIVAACPGRAAVAEKAARDFHGKDLAAALAGYQEIAACTRAPSIVHVRIGFVKYERGDFAGAEASYRRALALEKTITNQLSLLEALTRQNKPEATALYNQLMRYEGDRDDIWAGLAYAAFHREDVPGMRRTSAKAIALGTKWWQAWFTAAVAEGLAERPDYPRALGWLDKADALGAPRKYTSGMRSALEEGARNNRR